SIPSATGSVGRSHAARAMTLGASAPYRATSEDGSRAGNSAPESTALRKVATGLAGAPTSGRLRVRHSPARSPRDVTARSTASSAMYRYSVSLPPRTLDDPA